jgi:hypothetical protein
MPSRGRTGASGRGQGQGKATDSGFGRGLKGGTRLGAGPGGYCVCPNCGEQVAHQEGIPCLSVKCPKCGNNMVRL